MQVRVNTGLRQRKPHILNVNQIERVDDVGVRLGISSWQDRTVQSVFGARYWLAFAKPHAEDLARQIAGRPSVPKKLTALHNLHAAELSELSTREPCETRDGVWIEVSDESAEVISIVVGDANAHRGKLRAYSCKAFRAIAGQLVDLSITLACDHDANRTRRERCKVSDLALARDPQQEQDVSAKPPELGNCQALQANDDPEP
jgi:hypothetical protein